jgi:hypothetical protein
MEKERLLVWVPRGKEISVDKLSKFLMEGTRLEAHALKIAPSEIKGTSGKHDEDECH